MHVFYSFLLYVLCGGYLLTAAFYYKQLALLPFIVPLLYFIVTFFVALVLQRKLRAQLYPTLLYFLLAVAIAYVSYTPAQFGDPFAFLLYNTVSLLGVSFLIHFLSDYYKQLGISWPYIKSITFYYSFPALAFICSVGALIVPSTMNTVQTITIFLFANGLLNILFVLVVGYHRSHAPQLVWLTTLCIVPFMPFVLGFIVPTILNVQPLLAAELAALFFVVIPLGFIVFQVGERLFGVKRFLSRVRYHTLLAGSLSLLVAGIALLVTSSWQQSCIIGACNIVFVYAFIAIKERFDERLRQKTHATVMKQAVFQQLNAQHTRQQLLNAIPNIVQAYFGLPVEVTNTPPETEALTYEGGIYTIWIAPNVTLQLGDTQQVYYLTNDELEFLQLLAMYISTLLQQFDAIEHTLADATVEKMAWQLVEREKKMLAQELHDTIMQEQLQLARQLPEDAPIREQLLDLHYELREFCETVHPPLLEAVGLEGALQKLIQKTKLRADFKLHYSAQLTNVTDDALSLMLYRTVQELLSNAMKHSQATSVTISLTVFEQFFTLRYEDDGVGFETMTGQTFGLSGIQQRVQFYKGVIRKLDGEGTTFIVSNRKEHVDAYTRH